MHTLLSGMDEQKPPNKSVAENFCTEFVSEMKIPDYVQLHDKIFNLKETWRAEWERGVQIPVEKTATHNFAVDQIFEKKNVNRASKRRLDFSLPKSLIESDENLILRKRAATPYNLDLLDVHWISDFSKYLQLSILPQSSANKPVSMDETLFENTMSWLEMNCNDAMTTFLGANRNAGYG